MGAGPGAIGSAGVNIPSGSVAGGDEPPTAGGAAEPTPACDITYVRIFAVDGVSAGGATAGIGAVPL